MLSPTVNKGHRGAGLGGEMSIAICEVQNTLYLRLLSLNYLTGWGGGGVQFKTQFNTNSSQYEVRI